MRTEILELDERFGREFTGRYVFQEITWARRSHIIQKYTKYHPVTGQVQSSDFIAIQAETIWASLKEQPVSKPLTLQKLLSEDDGIPIELGELFSKVVNKLNGMTNEDVRFLLEQLDEENRTRLFQSFGFVKPSDGPQNSLQDSQPKPSNNSSSSLTS
jgi:hypothetical protein